MATKRKTARRSFLKGSAGVGGGLVASGLGAPMIWAQSQPTQINVGAWGGLYGEMIHGYVGEMFEQETGVKINYVRGATRRSSLRCAPRGADKPLMSLTGRRLPLPSWRERPATSWPSRRRRT